MKKTKTRKVTRPQNRTVSKSVMKRKIIQSLAAMNRESATLDVYTDDEVTVYFDQDFVIIVTTGSPANEVLLRRKTFAKIARRLISK